MSRRARRWTVNSSLLDILQEEIVSVVDVGARGRLYPQVEPIAERVHMLGFEPSRPECTRLNENAEADPWHAARVLPIALSDAAGKRTLRHYRDPLLDSLLPPNPAVRYSPDWVVESEEDVTVMTLDALREDGTLTAVDVMKIDTQGTELDILRGAETLLPTMLAVDIETGFLERYEGQSTFEESAGFLRERGFTLFAITPVYYGGRFVDKSDEGPPSRRQLSHCDALFLRDSGWVEERRSRGDSAPLRKLVAIHLLYGFIASALKLAELLDSSLHAEVTAYASVRENSLRWRADLLSRTIRTIARPSREHRFAVARQALTVEPDRSRRWDLSLPPPV